MKDKPMYAKLENLYATYVASHHTNSKKIDYEYLSKREYFDLLEAGYVEIDPAVHNGGRGFMRKVAVRITEEGINFLKKFGDVEEKNDIETVNQNDRILKPTIKENNMSEVNFEFAPIPATVRKSSARGSKYPFDAMPEPQGDNCAYFTVSGEDEIKKVQSALGNANRRLSEPTGETKISRRTGKEVPVMRQIRKFTSRRHTEDGVTTLYIFREM